MKEHREPQSGDTLRAAPTGAAVRPLSKGNNLNQRLLTLLAALFATSALIVAGCGGDDSSDDEPAPTKAEYITQADDICVADQEEIQTAAADVSGDPDDPATQEVVTNDVLPIYQDQLAELRDLTPPEGDEDATEAIYSALEEALAAVDEDPAAIGDPTVFAEANDLATEYGLKECGN